jgi:hypothetical protein
MDERPPSDDDVIIIGGRGACPECRQGKHDNCFGDGWDLESDAPAVCPCWADNHGRRPARTVEDEEADRAEEAHYRHTRLGAFEL